jgi:hypothetical protein
VNDCPVHAAPSLGFVRAYDHQIGKDIELAQLTPQAIGLLNDILNLRLDHQEIKIAVLAGLAPRMGTEQDHPRLWRRGLQQPPASLRYDRLVEHAITVARNETARLARPQPLALGTGCSTEPAPSGATPSTEPGPDSGGPEGCAGLAGALHRMALDQLRRIGRKAAPAKLRRRIAQAAFLSRSATRSESARRVSRMFSALSSNSSAFHRRVHSRG